MHRRVTAWSSLQLSCVAHGVLFCPPKKMWKSAVGHNVSVKVAAEGDDWETDPDFEVLCTSWSVRY